MSTSTDGILAFGVTFDEGDQPWGEEDYEDWLLSKIPDGPRAPSEEYRVEDLPLWKDYWKAKQAALDALGVTCENYCAGDYPLWALVVKSSAVTANRGYPKGVDPQAMVAIEDVHRATWDAAMKVLGLDLADKPLWWLMSYWG